MKFTDIFSALSTYMAGRRKAVLKYSVEIQMQQ